MGFSSAHTLSVSFHVDHGSGVYLIPCFFSVSTMADNEDGRGNNKRQCSTKPTVADFMKIAREFWRRDPEKARAAGTEDRDFREMFGCGVFVAHACWSLLSTLDLVPMGGNIEKFMWSLHFMKVYGKTASLCSACGGIDPHTHHDWVWKYIDAIASLESVVVSLSFNRDAHGSCCS